jgi:hypothetical protein
VKDFINLSSFKEALASFGNDGPFDHCIIDDFFLSDVAAGLEAEFPAFNDSVWHQYDNAIEIKKVCNNWNYFPPLTYSAFTMLNSEELMALLTDQILDGRALYSDPGLNGGGWHIHRQGGKLNTHLDYSLHPKLGLQRKLNIIIYMNSQWRDEWGGHLGLWGNESSSKPGQLVKSVAPKFNRAVIFDTTQNSWHGLPDPLKCPEDQFRKSLAVYCLCEPPADADKRGKALFAPTAEQESDQRVLDLIKKRAHVKTAADVYKDS